MTDDKPQVIAAGRELRLAQADIFKEEGKTEDEKPAEAGKPEEPGKAGEKAESKGISTTTKVVLGVIAIGGIAAAAGGGGGGGGDSAPASQASP